MAKITIGLVQMAMSPTPEQNLAHALDLISQAAKRGAQIVCLPELFTSQYFPQYENEKHEAAKNFAETIPGKTTEALARAAQQNSIVLVGGSIYEKDGSKLYNTSAVFDEKGKMLGKYRKMHVPHDDCFYEENYFSKGDLGFQAFDTKLGKISPLICYDQWFPEAARIAALSGAQIVFYPTAIGTVDGVGQAEGNWQDAWETAMRGHAIANAMVVAAANRVGREGKMEFWGGSFVCDAFGKTLARGGKGEEIVIAQIDSQHSKSVREGWRFFYHRRPDAYSKITEAK